MPVPTRPTFPRYLGGFDSRSTPVIESDVLVVGAGIAGAAAALAAGDRGASVLCLSKSPLDDVNTAWAKGGIAAVLSPDDDFESHVADTLRVGAGLSDPAVVRRVVAGGPEAFEWLTELGARFDRHESGELHLGREGGHSMPRVIHAQGDATGREIVRVLAAALRRHPRILLRIGWFVRDLLTDADGRCVGVVAHDGDRDIAVHAGAVILATGGAGQVYRETTNPRDASGDGLALGLRAGAVLADMEFVQFHPTVLYIAGASRFLISEVVRGAGAILRDQSGTRFMPEVHADGELAPRDVVSRAILARMVATGDTHVYLDLSEVAGDPHRDFPSISKICRKFDIDIARDRIPVRPGAHYLIGGLQTDLDGRTSLPGLFATGEAAVSYLHGANRLASNSLLEGAVLGRTTGVAAAAEQRPSRLPRIELPPADADATPQLHLDDVLYSLKSLMWRQVGLERSAPGLHEAIHRITLWHHYLLRAHGQERRAHELRNMLTVSAGIAVAAATRTESRGTHYRTDHPLRDDTNWCRHVTVYRSPDGTLETGLSVPIEASDLGASNLR